MRSSKSVNSVTTTHVWIGTDIALDITSSGNVISYVQGRNGAIKSDYGWHVYNAHGDVVRLTDSSENVIKHYDYDPYGIEKGKDNSDPNPYRYCGEYYDKETGYTYLRARYYNPNLGRFINEDPIMDGHNWYVYANNNPIMYQDPSGLSFILVAALVGAAVFAWGSNAHQATNGFTESWDWGNINNTAETLKWAGIGAGAGALGGGTFAAATAGSFVASTSAVAAGTQTIAAVAGTSGLGAAAGLVAQNFSQATNQVSQTFTSFTTPKNTVLWSGGNEAKNAATQFAQSNGGKTLEMTFRGRALESFTRVFGYDKMKPLWDKASHDFANKATGNVTAFINPDKFRGVDSIFSSIEYPAVARNVVEGLAETIRVIYLS
ncbi:MAG: RHS repeat-associated core domain-containing protein [Oscillospiraceae bacterium]|nr:RHS repeat-associated core domain-containing protein [Oscillospiraceae bacterium]